MTPDYDREYMVLPDGSIPMTPSGKPYIYTSSSENGEVLWFAGAGGMNIREADGNDLVLPGNYDGAWMYCPDGGYEIVWYDSDGNSYCQYCRDGKIIWSGAMNQNFSEYDPATGNLEYWDSERNSRVIIDRNGNEINKEAEEWDPYWKDEDKEFGVTVGYFSDHIEVLDAEGKTVAAFSEIEAE